VNFADPERKNLDKIIPENQKFVEPELISSGQYLRAREEYLEMAVRTRALRSIYQIGEISDPGISDLDLVLILDSRPPKGCGKEYSIFSLPGWMQYIFLHEPIIYDNFLAKDMFKIEAIFSMQHLWGERVSFDKPCGKEKEKFYLSMLLDICVKLYPRQFLEILSSRVMNVRKALISLKSLGYPLHIFFELTRKDIDGAAEFIESVQGLRSRWFNMNNDRYGVLIEKLKEAVRISLLLISGLNKFLEANLSVDPGLDRVEYRVSRHHTLFVRDWDAEHALQKIIQILREKKIIISILPMPLSCQLLTYADCEGEAASFIKKHLRTSGERSLLFWAYGTTSRLRMERFERHLHLMKRMKFYSTFYMMNFGNVFLKTGRATNTLRALYYTSRTFLEVHRLGNMEAYQLNI
jgi:hypothetical protein